MDTSMVFSASKGRIRTEGSDVQGSGGCDSNDMLASLLASATVALDTDRRAAKRCIQRAAVLLGIELSPGGMGPQSARVRGASLRRGKPSDSDLTSRTNWARVSEPLTSQASSSSARAISFEPFARPLGNPLLTTSRSSASREPSN
jgi:hypothetical protein